MQRLVLAGARVASRPAAATVCRRAATAPARRLASQPATAESAAKDVSVSAVPPATPSVTVIPPTSSSGASASATAAPLQTPHAAPGSSAWQRLVAFTTGVGVSSLWFYYTISQDVWHSTAVIESSLADFRADVTASNRELRQRVAILEHQVSALKK